MREPFAHDVVANHLCAWRNHGPLARLHRIHRDVSPVTLYSEFIDWDLEHLVEIFDDARLVDQARLVTDDAEADHVLHALKGRVWLLPVIDVELAVEALVMMLAGPMVAGVRFPVRLVVRREVDVDVALRAAADAGKEN